MSLLCVCAHPVTHHHQFKTHPCAVDGCDCKEMRVPPAPKKRKRPLVRNLWGELQKAPWKVEVDG